MVYVGKSISDDRRAGGGITIITGETPTASLKFDKNYWPDETMQIVMSGDLDLSLNTSVTNVVGNINFFDVVADGLGAINLVSGFKSNGIFPSDLDETVLDAGTYLFCCIYSTDGIVINVPALAGGVAPEPGTPPTASNVYFTGQPIVGQTMTGWYTYTAGSSGDPESGSTYQWYRATDQSGTGRAAISGATFKNYVVQAGDENFYLQFEVTVSDGTNDGTHVSSSWSRQVSLTDTFPPEIQLQIIEESTPSILKLVFDEVVTATNLGYSVEADEINVVIDSLSGSGTNILLLQLERFIVEGEVITFSYDSVTGDTIDGNTNELVDIVDRSVTNEAPVSPISSIPYNSDLTSYYSYEHVELDDITGKVTKLINPIKTSLSLNTSTTDASRPELDLANKKITINGKKITGSPTGYEYSSDDTFTVVFLMEQINSSANSGNRALMIDQAYEYFKFQTYRLAYVQNTGTITIPTTAYNINYERHVITCVCDGVDLKFYLDDQSSPFITRAVTLTDLILSNLFCTYVATAPDYANPSDFEAFSEILIYNRALLDAEKNIVINSYLSGKYSFDVSDRPSVSAFTVDNVSNGGTVNNGDTVEFTVTTADARTLKSIIIIQTTNGLVISNTAPDIILSGTATSFTLDVPPFYVQANNELGVMVVDELGRVSDLVVDTTVNFTITDV